ncbi:hypothetical protein ACHAXT_003324 [Thalassiosira profunda]
MSSTSTPRKKNAASQFRSRRAKRISHPLMKGEGEEAASTPPRVVPVTPATPEHPSLLNALEMAARPSTDEIDHPSAAASASAAPSPPTSYASSIEAMAALVEKSHSDKKRSPRTSPRTSPRKLPSHTSLSSSSSSSSRSPTKLRKGGGNVSSGSRSKTQGSRKASTPQAHGRKGVWMVAIPLLLSFLACECFLGLLVFRFKDVSAAPSGASLLTSMHAAVRRVVKGSIDEKEEEEAIDTLAFVGDAAAAKKKQDDLEDSQQESEMESDDLAKLQSKLDTGFAKLKGLSLESGMDKKYSREYVESLCGNVWTVASERLSSEPFGLGEVTLEQISQMDASPWKSLALDAQYCLGGAGVAFLTKDVDAARLRVSTKVFDRLMYVERYNLDVRAGLGTSLLIKGIFHIDEGGSDAVEANDDTQQRLLTLATYHLKVASTFSSKTQQAEVAVKNRSSTHAAVLHNLALGYLALGDTKNSVPVLLRAAALRREQDSEEKPYWNAPSEILQLAEEKALLLGAKSKVPAKPQEKKRPFFR